MRVLLVETEAHAAVDAAHLLAAAAFDVERADRISTAMERLLVEPIDCVLVDVGVADDLDLEVIERILLAALHAPVVVLSACDDEDLGVRAIRAGAQEFVVKDGLSAAALRRHVLHSIERRRIRSRLAHQALHDPLTGLPNRVLFFDRLRQALSRLGRTQTCLAVMFIDLDGFKAVNDRDGHEAGDAVLGGVARSLEATLRGGDSAARLGGDEFVVLCEDVAGEGEARRIAERLLAWLPTPASIGVALAGRGDEEPKALVRDADVAMYHVKRRGGGGYEVARGRTTIAV